MEILAYGEDALTLWALKNKLEYILQELKDLSNPSQCQAFFRPSFGRRGGPNSSQFGEFDFILLSADCIYLGESKWDNSSEKIIDGRLELRDEQLIRHKLFKFYIDEWILGNCTNWQDFLMIAKTNLSREKIVKPIAPINSLLAENLQTTLKIIKEHLTDTGSPKIRNLLLYFHKGLGIDQLPQKAGVDFYVVSIDYSKQLTGNYIKL
jgi:hypothetical protein